MVGGDLSFCAGVRIVVVVVVKRDGPPRLCRVERAVTWCGRHPLLMVGTCPGVVERMLGEGLLKCPVCGGVLARWGHARERSVRGLGERLRPLRGRCRGCARTHVLLPVSVLLRRADCVDVIGAALVAKALGWGHRRIAVVLGVAESTVRGWLRRFGRRARWWWERFTALWLALDPDPGPVAVHGSVFADAVEVIGLAAGAGVRRFGPAPPWRFASAVSGGLLLAPAVTGSVLG